jgi:hypothetical protein
MRKTKVSTVKKTVKNQEVIEMFNKMMGKSEPDAEVVIPKYEKIYELTNEVLQLLQKFVASKVCEVLQTLFDRGVEQIKKYVEDAFESIKKMELEHNDGVLSGEELHAINSDPEKLQAFFQNMNSRYKIPELGSKYSALKEHPVVKEMVMIARNLKSVLVAEQTRTKSPKNDIEDKSSLKDDFILNSDGDYLTLFNFTSLDFKQIWISDILNSEHKKYILYVLHLIYSRVINIVKLLTSPDIDVDKFSEAMIENIDSMRKHIPRCDQAFEKIKSSVGLLKENFGDYYKDFVTSQTANPGIIIEHFVIDVAKKNTADLKVTRQFKEIIKFYNNQISGKNVSDPKLQNMLSMVSENINILEGKLDKASANPETEKKCN